MSTPLEDIFKWGQSLHYCTMSSKDIGGEILARFNNLDKKQTNKCNAI